MFPADPRQMQNLLRQMGVKTRIINAEKVIIHAGDKRIIIENPQVMEMDIKGEKSFNISGKVHEEEDINEEDVRLIMEKTGVNRERAIKALKEKGDVASAILHLSEEGPE